MIKMNNEHNDIANSTSEPVEILTVSIKLNLKMLSTVP